MTGEEPTEVAPLAISGLTHAEATELAKAEAGGAAQGRPEQAAQSLTSDQLLARPKRVAGMRRPGVSGRIVAGKADFRLPEPLVISKVEMGSVFSSTEDDMATGPIAAPVGAAPDSAMAVAEESFEAVVDQGHWTPTVVPPPSYTLSDVAARWEPKELTAADYAQASQTALRVTEEAAEQARQAGLTHPETASGGLPARRIFNDKGIDLDQALNRRRTANS